MTYSVSTEVLTYSNSKIKSSDNMIVLYNQKNKYEVLDTQDKQGVEILGDFIASIDENITIKQFTSWY